MSLFGEPATIKMTSGLHDKETAMEKGRVQQILDAQPDKLDVDEFVERLYLLRKIELAEEELARGEGIPHETAKKRLAAWLK